ncbi:MAG TPA: hypothetical protein VL359_09275 [bacterium]|nr:hypothetical protein [bacterium]
MQAQAADPAHLPYVQAGSIYAVPSLHGQWRFAMLVRLAFHHVRPQAIAVELPDTLEPAIREGVQRLPYLSVVAYEDFTEEMDKVRQILPVTPEDSLVEAVRLGLEHGVPVHFIDRDVLNHQARPVRVPDDYLVERIGLRAYWEKVSAGLPAPEAGSVDEARELHMAARLQALPPGRVLLVCGMAHLAPILRHLQGQPSAPPGAVTQREHTLYTLSADSIPHALGDYPYLAYAYELSRLGLAPQDFPQLMPLPHAQGPEHAAAREAAREAQGALLQRLQRGASGTQRLDAHDALAHLVQGAVRLYQREWKEQPAPQRLATVSRYARNLGLVARRLAPSKYHLVLASQTTVNDDFAFQVLRLADFYPFHEEDSALPELQMQGQTGQADGETLVLRLRLPPAEMGDGPGQEPDLQGPPQELTAGTWEQVWDERDHHVSHLPQDTRLEGFFQYIRDKCKRLLSDQQVRVHELKASLMDGLDLRETLRNLPLGKLYVREELPGIAEVGPVVVIFHKPGEERQYPHEKTWFSEHAEESDLALYSTEPGQQFDGPGISRCQYGGVLSLFPPTGRAPVWGNPRYGGARNRPELLLRAAIDLSRKPIVAYVAPQGPGPDMLALAASRGIQILYVPLDSLSADQLKRVRTFHVLSNRDLRPIARLYLN